MTTSEKFSCIEEKLHDQIWLFNIGTYDADAFFAIYNEAFDVKVQCKNSKHRKKADFLMLVAIHFSSLCEKLSGGTYEG